MTTYSWKNAANGDWGTTSDWSPAGPVNATTADAVIAIAGAYTVTIAAAESFVVEEYVVGFGDPEEGVWIEVCARITLEVAREALQQYCAGPRVLEEVVVTNRSAVARAKRSSAASAGLPAPTKRVGSRGKGKRSRRLGPTSRQPQRRGTR